MTIEEKRVELQEMCRSQNGCEDCPVLEFRPSSGTCRFTTDEYVDFVYDAIQQDRVNHPAHYSGKHECIEVMRVMFGDEAVKAFCRCNSFKYRFRADRKNGAEDIKKAEWYEDYLFRMEKGDTHDKI